MATIEELLAQASRDQSAIVALRKRLSHASSYTERNSLLRRIRKLEDDLNRLYAQYLRALKKAPISVYGTRKKPRTYAGLSVTMDISTDGLYFSNPAPSLAHLQRAWVRARIDMAQKSPFSSVKTEIPTFIRCTWVIPRGWRILDLYSRFGRNEYVVSLPLVVTREFKAPASGSTKANFGMFADPFYPVDFMNEPPEGAQVELTDVTATLDAGSYYIFTRTSNVLSARTLVAFPATSFKVDEVDDRLFWTDGNTYVLVRAILSGPYAGDYIQVHQDGIEVTELVGAV